MDLAVLAAQAVALWGRLDSRGLCPLRTPAAPGLVAFAWLGTSRIPGLRRSRERDLALPPENPRGFPALRYSLGCVPREYQASAGRVSATWHEDDYRMDAVSPSQPSSGKSPVPLPGTSKATLSGPFRSCDTRNAQDAVSPSQPSSGEFPVHLPSTSTATLSGSVRSCDTQNAQDNDSPSQPSSGEFPVHLPGTSTATLSGPSRSCDTQNAHRGVLLV